jgi:methionyl-tRNA synthetase
MKRFLITTPIYYVNDKPHIGHAYTTLAADVLARFYRDKTATFFLTGTDEHGTKVCQSAEKNGKEVKKFCDENSRSYQKTWKELEIGYDFFVRTTDKYHEEFVKLILNQLKEKDYLYEGEYEGLYCEGCEEYILEKDLVDGCCFIHKTRPKKLKEKNWFFKLSEFQDKILQSLDKDFVVLPKNRENELLSFLKKEKLRDVAISRPSDRVKWGIELPWDKNQVIYVWIDALLNYLSGPLSSIGFNFRGKNWEDFSENLADFWPAQIQLIGKDILRFHAVIWPALLLALDLPLPKILFAHGFFTINGDKISKSLGNAIDPIDLKKQFGLSALRYYIFRDFSFGEDGDVSLKNLVERYNADLANNIGNLVSRSLTLVQKYGDLKAKIEFHQDSKLEKLFSELKFKEILERINLLAHEKNQLIDKEKPWELIKEATQGKEFAINNDSQAKFEQILGSTLETILVIAHYLKPFIPSESGKIQKAVESLTPAIVFPKIENDNFKNN